MLNCNKRYLAILIAWGGPTMKRGERVVFESSCDGVVEASVYSGPCGVFIRKLHVPHGISLLDGSTKPFIKAEAKKFGRPATETDTDPNHFDIG